MSIGLPEIGVLAAVAGMLLLKVAVVAAVIAAVWFIVKKARQSSLSNSDRFKDPQWSDPAVAGLFFSVRGQLLVSFRDCYQ